MIFGFTLSKTARRRGREAMEPRGCERRQDPGASFLAAAICALSWSISTCCSFTASTRMAHKGCGHAYVATATWTGGTQIRACAPDISHGVLMRAFFAIWQSLPQGNSEWKMYLSRAIFQRSMSGWRCWPSPDFLYPWRFCGGDSRRNHREWTVQYCFGMFTKFFAVEVGGSHPRSRQGRGENICLFGQ